MLTFVWVNYDFLFEKKCDLFYDFTENFVSIYYIRENYKHTCWTRGHPRYIILFTELFLLLPSCEIDIPIYLSYWYLPIFA